MPSHGVARSVASLPLLLASPILYGAGFWRGLFTKLNSAGNHPEIQVRLEKHGK